MSVEATTDGDVFLAYQLKPGQQVVMDYLGAHKVDGVGKLIEDTGASLCYLPPYSPDFNPIEKCWAQMKQKLRALKARSVITSQQALDEALPTLTPQNAVNYFRTLRPGLRVIHRIDRSVYPHETHNELFHLPHTWKRQLESWSPHGGALGK